jgi:phosphatidylserine/phosphatidylglycerophosphate/cardiolipin synthase-like enzyme
MTELARYTLQTQDWSTALRRDIEAATLCVALSSLSMLPPTPRQTGAWPALWHALVAAPGRGIACTIVLPKPTSVHPATLQNYKAATMLTAARVRVLWCPGPRLLHAKTCVIDKLIAWVGSGNFTQAAAAHNHEAWTRLADPAIAAHLDRFILALAADTHAQAHQLQPAS